VAEAKDDDDAFISEAWVAEGNGPNRGCCSSNFTTNLGTNPVLTHSSPSLGESRGAKTGCDQISGNAAAHARDFGKAKKSGR
jgi:hypothetical protein